MYLAYGWPQSIPLDPDNSDRVVLLRLLGRFLLAVCPASLHLWSAAQHRVRLARSDRSPESLSAHGYNAHAVWSPDAKTVAVLTSSFYLYVYKVQHLGKQLIVGGKQVPGLCLASISLIITEKVPLANGVAITSNFVCDNKSMLLGLSNGHVQVMSWNAEFSDSFKLGCSVCSSEKPTAVIDALVFDPASLRDNTNARPAPCCTGNSSIVHVELSVKLRLLVALYSGCRIALCTIGKKGLRQPGSIRVERWLDTDDAMCTSVASEQQILAVGCSRGVVELYDLAENTRHIRTISLYDWGYSVEDTGPVACISWTPDNCAFAVGWKFRGLTVWSVSGCRLMCTIRQTGSNSASSPMVKRCTLKFEPLMGGTSHIQWDDNGYKLFAVEENLSERVLAFSFAKCCLNRGLSGTTYSHQVLYGDDRILLVQPDDADELKILHLNVPVKYELLFFPRYHLDYSSLLYRKPLLGRPIVMDVFQDYILVTYSPFDVHIFHVMISGELSPSSNPVLQLSTVRELSIMSPKSPPVSMRFIPEQNDKEVLKRDTNESYDLLSQQPSRCLILRTNGELSVLDMDDGHEHALTNSIELFWVTCSQFEEKGSLIKEVSWLDYGHQGMQVWYPSHGAGPFKQEDFLQLDPELEFDREVYPLGLLPNVGVVVGVSQRMSFSTAEFPCFEPSPQAQTILHCLLRHLLQRDKIDEALRLANLSAEKPHFSHCLEWLLFTVFDADISRPSASKNQASQKVDSPKNSLLEKTCDLLRNFPEYMDVVVSVARKTDGRHWADLFSTAGRSTEMFEECFQQRWYRTAACYILVIAKLEGPAVSQYCALRLLQATLDESLYELAGELVRFLLRSGRDFENATPDSEKLSPRFLGYFLFRSPYKRQSSDLRRYTLFFTLKTASVGKSLILFLLFDSNSMKELSPHIASVMNILERHASYLMSGKELSKLVAFVKGTQFDLVEYLQRERQGSARLENFASALELIGQKVLVDLFRHDLRLWKAYSITLQSHDVFTEYLDLLNILEEELSSVSDLTLQNGPLS
ncbi:Quinoprotein amine dehydrogenase beta chain-like [Zea mays]|uniref:Quinoprotein amine dehydrogenase beta chain-like n=1 Tax=Zea mays TaxID=4577 RepID=A0A1D6HMG7_MAIZE|nr:Quinoprotein amine dehydrogenase beta chain-like [Zea mays]AQK75570.1 Quinoprotein amine dehydrogenase beta chain-like [Zea mays]AQK75571.1 Quinoprotein amine dehydrogenase beta chain-like [Zea mays]